MPTNRFNTTIRLTEDERKEAEEKMQSYGYTQLSAFFRFAVKQLRIKTRS